MHSVIQASVKEWRRRHCLDRAEFHCTFLVLTTVLWCSDNALVHTTFPTASHAVISLQEFIEIILYTSWSWSFSPSLSLLHLSFDGLSSYIISNLHPIPHRNRTHLTNTTPFLIDYSHHVVVQFRIYETYTARDYYDYYYP